MRDPWLKALIVLLSVIAGLYLAGLLWTIALQFADIILMLILAWLISFALEPVAAAIVLTGRMARPVAVGLVYLWLLIVLSAAIVLIVPVVALQISQIANNLPTYLEDIGQWLAAIEARLPRQGALGGTVFSLDYSQFARSVEAAAPAIVNNALALATGVASVLFSLILLLMFSFYFLLDGGKFTDAALRALPPGRRDEANYLIYSIHRAFGGYIRGQLIQAVVYGIGTAIVMMIADLSYTAVASIFAFVVMLIPFVGPILGLIPPVAISLLVHPESTWWVLLLLLALQQVVLNIMAPRVMGQSVGVHPVVVLLALLIGAKLAGMWGAIFAVPVAATMVAMVSFYRLSVEDRAAQTTRVSSEIENGQARSRQLPDP